jgi:hypothetical protein
LEVKLKARDYAISLGLAKPGKGKLSKAAHDAIQKAINEGKTFVDYNNGRVNRNVTDSRTTRPTNGTVGLSIGTEEEQKEYPPIPPNPVRHTYNTIYGIDAKGRTPLVIGFESCAICLRHVRYCLHEIPQLPVWIGGGNGLIDVPTKEQKWQAMSMTRKLDLNSTKQ